MHCKPEMSKYRKYIFLVVRNVKKITGTQVHCINREKQTTIVKTASIVETNVLFVTYLKVVIFISVPYNRKKMRNFFRHFRTEFLRSSFFFSRQNPAFLFPAENHRQLLFAAPCLYFLHKASIILGYLRISYTDDLFFLENAIKKENKMPLPAQTIFCGGG